MFPTEFDFEMRRQQMERDAAHQQLIRLAQEDEPSLWQRVRTRLSIKPVHAAMPVICESVPRRDVIVVSR